MGVTTTNLFAGPADVFVAMFGAAEPLHAAAAPGAPWRDVGATGAEAVLNLGQTYVDLEAEQLAMSPGADLSAQSAGITCAFAEHTMPNLRTALNMVNAGGTNEVQTIALGSATAGSIAITFNGQATGAIPYNANTATVQTALDSLSNVDPGDIVVSGGPLPGAITLTFAGQYAGGDVPQVTVAPTGLTGGAVTVNTTTPGVPGPTLGISGKLLNAQPNYSAVMLRGRKPGGGMRHAVVRRGLSTEGLALPWKKGEQKFIPVTFKAYFVSDSIDAVWVEDRQS